MLLTSNTTNTTATNASAAANYHDNNDNNCCASATITTNTLCSVTNIYVQSSNGLAMAIELFVTDLAYVLHRLDALHELPTVSKAINKQSIGCGTQLASGGLLGGYSGEDVWKRLSGRIFQGDLSRWNIQGRNVSIPMHDYKCLRIVVMICATMINKHTDTQKTTLLA